MPILLFCVVLMNVNLDSQEGDRNVQSSSYEISNERLLRSEGRHFYYFEDDFSCAAPMPGSPAVASWRDHIAVQDRKFIQYGSKCEDVILKINTPSETVELSPDLNSLKYRGKVFLYRLTPPEMVDRTADKNGR